MIALDYPRGGLRPEHAPDGPVLAAVSAVRAATGPRAWLVSRLDRLLALMRPRTGGPAGDSQGPGPVAVQADAGWRHAQSLALSGRLATGLVHDFNNALLVAMACLAQIEHAAQDADAVTAHAQAASEALRRATDLARRLTRLGRPDDGTRQQVDLGDVVRASARLAEPVTRPCIELSVSYPAHALPVRVNAAQIENAILNLCLNARDAMPDGGTLHVTARSSIRWTRGETARTSRAAGKRNRGRSANPRRLRPGGTRGGQSRALVRCRR